jgi:hypothetical protein
MPTEREDAMEQSLHHSDRLFHGKIDDFEEACTAKINQYRQESDWISADQHVIPDYAMQRLWKIEKYISALERCKQEYREARFQMERALIARWSASEKEIPQALAEALCDGDFSRLVL